MGQWSQADAFPPPRSGRSAPETDDKQLDACQLGSNNGDTLVDRRESVLMIKKLVKHGNSWAIVLDRPILDLLKIDPESQVELTTDGRTITISPHHDEEKKSRVQSARKTVNEKHAKAFKKLAE
jgi:antitoxin component of MazEF toxin-antitoxin module